ncbi:MAG: DUF922 domain-containing protein [Bacteroidetes bacterium]|nr:DUF922 domain-containing protein [Bacteroidota bacterium]
MKTLFQGVLLFFNLSYLPAPAQSSAGANDDLVKWSATRKLQWSDYKADPDPNSDAAASTTTLLSIEYNMKNDQFGYKITSTFSRSRSWGRHKDAYILAHEQGHFDIAEIFARLLNKKMAEYKFNQRTYQKDLKKIYDDVTDDKEEMQNQYDKETRHSINKEKQAAWLKKIADMLKEYEAWANY